MTDDRAAPPDGWPDPHDSPCADCGHVWFAGERHHVYANVAAASPEDAEVVCVLCRRQRERPRSDTRWAGF
jgi:hypothetical protein